MSSRPFVIAEIGVNHEGNIQKALELIDAAAEAGANAVKFQTYKAELIAAKDSPSYWDTTEEKTESQYELFKKYDGFEFNDYERLARHAGDCGVEFMTTAFDIQSLDQIDPLVKRHKISSSDITNYQLLKSVAMKNKPVILSVGASTSREILEAIKFLEKYGAKSVTPLHCVLAYPTKAEEANILAIKELSKLTGRRLVIPTIRNPENQ